MPMNSQLFDCIKSMIFNEAFQSSHSNSLETEKCPH